MEEDQYVGLKVFTKASTGIECKTGVIGRRTDCRILVAR